MADRKASAVLPPEIRSLLTSLRWRIRAYVGLQGLSLAIIWLGAMFWLGLALDYLPVLAGIGEMPRTARMVFLSVVALVLAVILYRWLLRRILARLADHSLALLLERRFRDFQDGLITSVELTEEQAPGTEAGQQMLAETKREALHRVRSVQLADVFNFWPLKVSMALAVLLTLTIGTLYIINASAFETGVNRLVFLDDVTWPRQAHIEVVGVELRRGALDESSAAIVRFSQGSLKTAKGSNLSLLVRADASQRMVPEVCTIHYRTEEGDHGRVNMTSVGGIRDGYQLYKYDGKPFDGVLSAIHFDVVGFDHRVRDHAIQVVDSPTLVEVQLACEFPAYMVDEKLSQWLPRTLNYTSGLQLPMGTRLTLHCRANKPLTDIQIADMNTKQTVPLALGESSGDTTTFVLPVTELRENLTLDVTLLDTDGVHSERPFRIHLAGLEDRPPTIDMRLAGIGTAVTQDVIVPAKGKVTDDYGLDRVWIDVQVNEVQPREFGFTPTPTGEAETSVDFRTERGKPDGTTLQPTDKLVLTIRATDKRDLGSGPNQATGDRYQLDVVTADQLLTMLESRELNLRKRFEQIIEDMTVARDMLLRVKADGPGSGAADPEERSKERSTEDAAKALRERLERLWSLRVVRARQSLMQSQKSAQEILGVAAGFRDIREELINNRVDTEDRKSRLQELIADPLQQLGEQRFPELDRRLLRLSGELERVEKQKAFQEEDPATLAAAQETIDQANQLLRDMDEILKQMRDLEDFNELLDLVRSLIGEQEQLLNNSLKVQKKSVLDLRDLLK